MVQPFVPNRYDPLTGRNTLLIQTPMLGAQQARARAAGVIGNIQTGFGLGIGLLLALIVIGIAIAVLHGIIKI